MRKVIVLFLIMAIQIFGIAVTKLSANNDEGVVVPIEKSEEEGEENNPRIFNNSPIICLYSGDALTFLFYDSFEDMSIVVKNDTTGELLSFNTSSGSSLRIPVPSAGIYNISVATDSGNYYGSFVKSN